MWQQIRANRRRSALVVIGMAALLLAVGAGIGVLMAGGPQGALYGAAGGGVLWLVLWGFAASGGDDLMMRVSRAREVGDGELQQLRNVLEEMSIAASLDRVPKLYVIDDPAPNAFATGRRPEKAAVAVTTGLLAVLDRDELQGVVAHELGHIRNQDVKLMVLAGVMLGCIVMLADAGTRMLWFGGGRRSRGSDSGGGAVAAVVAVLVVILAPLMAQLFYFALSRRREYLADASAAAFTRYPEGLARALEKIGGARVPSRSATRVTAPMYISEPWTAARGGTSARRWFSTHPPIEERVRILRAMGGGAGVADYLQAYGQVHGGAPLIEGAAVPVGAAGLVGPPPLPGSEAPQERARRVREASDAMLRADGYHWRECAGCGATAKVPPALAGTLQRCPRCRTPYPTGR
jgi:heat shock protein HtpX